MALGLEVAGVGAPTMRATRATGTRQVQVVTEVVDVRSLRDRADLQFMGETMTRDKATVLSAAPYLGVTTLVDPA
jgi:hypothetical protein